VQYEVIRLCDGKNRLKAEAGTVPSPAGKGDRGRKPSRCSKKMENGRVFEIINQVIQQAFHHGFGNAFSVSYASAMP